MYFVEVILQELILQSPLLIIIKEEPKWVIAQIITQLLHRVNNLHKNKQICGFDKSFFTQNVNIMQQKKLILRIKVDFFELSNCKKKKSSLIFIPLVTYL